MWESRLDRLPQIALDGGRVRIAVADAPVARLLGLAWMDQPSRVQALLLPGCRSIHTFGMRFPLDLIWLDASGRILDVDANVPCRRQRHCRGAAGVVEIQAGLGALVFGAIARTGILF